MSIAGVVILYNPQEEVIENIGSYLRELDKLFVFDNSENPNTPVVEKIQLLPGVEYISFGENKGISFVLNAALKLAKHYQFLLTMDQDSQFHPGMMKKYKEILVDKYGNNASVAMFSVNFEGMKLESTEECYVERAITSGSVVDVRIAEQLGGFDENLFIDEVDNEFCYRAQLHGYGILCLPQIHLQHHLGNPIPGTLFGVKFKGLNHNKIRKYYITRNNIYVMKKYPRLRFYCFKELMKIIIKLLLVEPDKWNRILFMLRGIKDGVSGKMGKLNV